jgi:hypothetical protein
MSDLDVGGASFASLFLEGGALRRRIRMEKARVLQAQAPGPAELASQSALLQRIVVSVELDHLTSNECSQRS